MVSRSTPSLFEFLRLTVMGFVFLLVACAGEQDIPESEQSALEETPTVSTDNSVATSENLGIEVALVDENIPLVSGLVIPESSNNNSTADTVDTICLLYTSPSPRDQRGSRMPSSA